MILRKLSALFVCGSFLVLIVDDGHATIPEKYQTIVDRNSFGLNPPPPPSVAAAPPVPARDVKLTGFAEMSGGLRAFFAIQSKDPKVPTQYISLQVGQSENDVELVRIISATDGEVKILNSGQEFTLTLKKDALKGNPSSPPSAQAANVPAPQQAGASVVWTPPSTPSQSASHGFASPAHPTPAAATGGGRLPSAPSAGNFVLGGNNGNSQSVVFNSGHYASASTPAPTADIDPAEQRVLMEVQNEIARQKDVPMPPMPPLPRALGGAPAPPPVPTR